MNEFKTVLRNKKESLLLIFTIFFWILFIGVYYDHLQKNKSLLNEVADSVLVTGEVTDITGNKTTDIEIQKDKVSQLVENPNVTNPLITASAFSSFSKDNVLNQKFDIYINATNHVKACSFIDENNLEFYKGYDQSSLGQNEPICIIEKEYFDQLHMNLNDTIQLPIYTQHYINSVNGMFDFQYVENGNAQLKIVGVYEDNGLSNEAAQIVVPEQWLRQFVESKGHDFYYSSMKFDVKDPLQLNQLKQDIKEMDFSNVRPSLAISKGVGGYGDFMIIYDSLFVDRANKIHSTIELYELLQIPFFLLIILMINVVIFMIIRKRRVSMAVSYSLGLSKKRIFYSQFFELLILSIIAVIFDFIGFVIITDIPITQVIILLGIILIAEIIGLLISLSQLFKFDILDVLTHGD